MSNRKFFSGLPDTWINARATGPNRQQSSFYWPDESEVEEFSIRKNSRLRKSSDRESQKSDMSGRSTENEEMKKRHCNQMQSKIEFYDMVDTKDDNVKPIQKIPDKNKDPPAYRKAQTLRSRIEFYDFDDEGNELPEKNVGKSLENSKNVTNEMKTSKTIEHFVSVEKPREKNNSAENNDVQGKCLRNEESPQKEGLEAMTSRNSDFQRDLKSSPKQNSKLIPKNKELEENMKNLDINHEKSRKHSKYVDSFSESDDNDLVDYYHSRKQQQSNHLKIPSRRPPRTPDLDFDADYRYYEKNRRARYRPSRQENQPIRLGPRKIYSPELSDEDHYDFDEDYRQKAFDYLERQRSPERKISRPHKEEEFNDRLPPKRPGRYYQEEDDGAYYTDQARKQSSSSKNGNISDADYEKRLAEYDKKYKEQQEGQQYPSKPSSVISEARQRFHVNLKSNIFHNNNDYLTSVAQRKPSTVRNSATGRVGVGLPDIEYD
jgi:hypothetical protein